MKNIGIWDVSDNQPKRLQRGAVNLEKQLEDWIELHPDLIQQGLIILARQMRIESGILDLLGIDPLGNLVVIEIKRGNLNRKTVAQAIDYAACIHEMPANQLAKGIDKYLKTQRSSLKKLFQQSGFDETVFEDRIVNIIIVGTGRDTNLERMTNFLSGIKSSINVITFTIFENETGQRIVLRQLTELDTNVPESAAIEDFQGNPIVEDAQDASAEYDIDSDSVEQVVKLVEERERNRPKLLSDVERLMELAEKNGVGEAFKIIYEEATALGLYPRTYKWSIMYTPPSNKTRVLICAWVKPKHELLKVYIAPFAFAEFFPISEREVKKYLGSEGYHYLSSDDAQNLVHGLKVLFSLIDFNDENDEGHPSLGHRFKNLFKFNSTNS